jgi:hypothetical protein
MSGTGLLACQVGHDSCLVHIGNPRRLFHGF